MAHSSHHQAPVNSVRYDDDADDHIETTISISKRARNSPREWSIEEDCRLDKVVHIYGENITWRFISEYVGTRDAGVYSVF